jgi:hypothetical protein
MSRYLIKKRENFTCALVSCTGFSFKINLNSGLKVSRDSSVGTATGYGLVGPVSITSSWRVRNELRTGTILPSHTDAITELYIYGNSRGRSQ